MSPAPGPLDLRSPRRTSPFAALFDVVSPDRARDLLPLLVIALSSGRFVLVLVLGSAVVAALGALRWLRRLWWFDGRVLHLDEGVLVRNQRRIPVERIQHVELERSVRHQLLGLAAVRVETAGGTGAELRLDAVPLAEAEALRGEVLAALRPAVAAPGDTPPPPPPPAEVLVRLPPGRLLLAGITGPEVAAVLASLAFAIDALADLGVDPDDLGGVEVGRTVLALLVVAALPVWFLTAGLIAVVRKWDLTATVAGDELRVRYGLLRRHELVVRTDRVQDVRIAQRLLLRPFGRADLRIRSAASGSGDSSRVDIPLLDGGEVDRVLRRVLPAALPRPTLRPAPPAARRRAWARGAVASSVLGALVVIVAASTSWTLAAALAVVVPAGPVLGELSWRGLGWAERDGVHHSRTGALTRRTAIVPAARVQSSAVVSSWFQRRRSLASTRIDLAGAAVAVVDRDAAECRAIAADATAG